jgi:hypothetical protein
MEIKNGSIIKTKDGEYVVKEIMKMVNPFTLKPIIMCLVNVGGLQRTISENDIISVRNNHIKNIEEP